MAVRSGPGLAAGAAGLVALLLVLADTTGLGAPAAAVGLACFAALHAFVRRSVAACGATHLGPADLVTLARATLACGVAALVADALLGDPAGPALVALAAVALALDAVDGPVARRSGTASSFGARFDGEADAFLILVLSVHVSQEAGTWVLALGLARYLFAAGGWVWRWLRCPLPFRYWRKVVTAVVGIVLCVATADVLPTMLRDLALLGALALLAESFGRDVVWLWQRRPGAVEESPDTTGARQA